MKKIKVSVLFAACLFVSLALVGCGGKKLETKISLPSGEYMGEQEVILSNEGDGGNCLIYYTLDGSEPSSKSFLYEKDSPLAINYDSTLKAITINDGSKGPVAEATYTIKEMKEQTLTDVERVFVGNIRGSYELNGNTIEIDSAKRIIEWNIGGQKGSSKFTVSAPEDGDGESGTLTYTGNDGKEQKFEINMAPSGDNAVYFNQDNYNYLG
ncbi:chitobiase/beta-hexosaminidase C-terminal domain-containing protein [Eubacterium barkeri]|uniref:Chitobiase/beta-hexosaminidase C-terminal domain-containing protein n=1 Tax=Eubacterium barkeri TaxID=1528 RepID=A0A1H3J0Z6_EUBBA|nr:chitobiase/beta-hexosaminidase C-terminal domain-containing protein [Eubacterium barkeri]SDY33477.1 Chitobiase/beta-hexosaminidase C-terminal domain-containing protein [Eubacterium barkeri]